MPNAFGRRFDELCQQAKNIEATKTREDYIEQDAFLKWRAQVRNLIAAVCGTESQYFHLLDEADKAVLVGETNYGKFRRLKSVLLAAKEDYEGAYLQGIRTLIQADVFDSELEQAEELLSAGYEIPAAVIAGVVLETRLRQACQDHKLPIGKLDKMNADLAKAGVYSKLVQKQITAIADIRNNAAHGRSDQFNETDVANMVRDVRNLLASRLT